MSKDTSLSPDLVDMGPGYFSKHFGGKKCLVTGGSGFLGSWLCNLFLAAGSEVHCLDNFSTGVLSNVRHVVNEKKFKLVRVDVTKNFRYRGKFDFVVHMASRASPPDIIRHPIETSKANSIGTLNTLELSRICDAKYLYTSSSEVYGDPVVVPTPEEYSGRVDPVGPRSSYEEGKRFGESLCKAYVDEYDLDARIIRIFNSYGPRLREDGIYGRVISRFVNQTLRGRSLTIYGTGRQTRSFCYVTDTVRGIASALSRRGLKGVVLNIGSPLEINIIRLARLVMKLAGRKLDLSFLPEVPGEPRRRCPDIMKARKILEWEPRVSLEEGLLRTIEWFRQKMPS